MKNSTVYDIIGIGIGPFNLGLAALTKDIKGLSCAFFEQKETFEWHPGIMLENTRMRVPYYADLVTLADPCSQFNYMNFLKSQGRLIRFGVVENIYPTRKEYNAYCQWVAGLLPNLNFGMRCETVSYDKSEETFTVVVKDTRSQSAFTYLAKHIVSGIGSIPNVPAFARGLEHPLVLHSGEYLYHKKQLQGAERITIVGSGQSAAEIFRDMLDDSAFAAKQLYWLTRSPRFLPMDYSKLTLEMTSPEYITHFFGLGPEKKKQLLEGQDTLYKGINASLLEEIFEHLYLKSLDRQTKNIHLHTNCEVRGIAVENSRVQMNCYHLDLDEPFLHCTDAVILATGYKPAVPSFLEPVKELISGTEEGLFNVRRNYAIDRDGDKIFVQNAELASHGFNSADLGMGPYRNAVIINTVLGHDYFCVEEQSCFQKFGLPVSAGSPAVPTNKFIQSA